MLFLFEESSNGQIHSSFGSHYPVIKFPPAKFQIPLPPLGGIYPSPYPYMENLV